MELGEGAVRIFGTRQRRGAGRSSQVSFCLRGKEEALGSDGAYAVLSPTPNPTPSTARPLLKVLDVS